MKPVITLYDHIGLCLLIQHPSGVLYSNQAGGQACLTPQVEGIAVPLANDLTLNPQTLISPENDLLNHFTGAKHKGNGATNGIDDSDADYIDNVFEKYSLERMLSVDRDQLGKSYEAWVWVVISEDLSPSPIFTGLAPYPRSGVITWGNSD